MFLSLSLSLSLPIYIYIYIHTYIDYSIRAGTIGEADAVPSPTDPLTEPLASLLLLSIVLSQYYHTLTYTYYYY